MPTLGVLFGTIGLIEVGQGVVVVSSGAYPAIYSALIRQNSGYDVVLAPAVSYSVFIGGSSG